MGKPGPKLKEGARYENGRLKPQSISNDAGKPGTLIRSIVATAIRKAVDPRMGSVLGVMHLEGKITADEFAAGCAYAKLRGRYDRALGLPGRFTLSPDYGTARAISNRTPMTDEQVEAVKKRHGEMLEFLSPDLIGAHQVKTGEMRDGKCRLRWVSVEGDRARVRTLSERSISTLDRVCVDDIPCEWAEIAPLRKALSALIGWFGVRS